jgi:hypothetical protein
MTEEPSTGAYRRRVEYAPDFDVIGDSADRFPSLLPGLKNDTEGRAPMWELHDL